MSQQSDLRSACANKQLNDVMYLISVCSCDPHYKSKDGSTPLHDACENAADVVEYLITNHDCDPSCARWHHTTTHSL